MNYLYIYDSIIIRAKCRAKTRTEANKILGYSELHHIIPKCMNGTNEKDNLVYLSAREHFICHLLLTKIYPNNHFLLFSVHRLMYDKQGNKLNGKSYEWIKIKNSEIRKSLNKENCEWIKRQSEKMTGRTKYTHAGVAKMAITLTGRTKENHEGVAKMAETKKGRTKENHEGTKRQSEKMTGRTKYTHAGVAKMSETKSKLSKSDKMYLLELKNQGWSISKIREWVQFTFPWYTEVSNSGIYKFISNAKHGTL